MEGREWELYLDLILFLWVKYEKSFWNYFDGKWQGSNKWLNFCTSRSKERSALFYIDKYILRMWLLSTETLHTSTEPKPWGEVYLINVVMSTINPICVRGPVPVRHSQGLCGNACFRSQGSHLERAKKVLGTHPVHHPKLQWETSFSTSLPVNQGISPVKSASRGRVR